MTSLEASMTSFYHLTTWRLEELSLDSEYVTSWEMSHYGQRQYDLDSGKKAARKQLDGVVASIATNGQESMIDGLLDALASNKASAQLDKEKIFEQVRQSDFPDKPSRLNAMFLCESEEISLRFSDLYGLHIPPYIMIEVECLETTPRELPGSLREKGVTDEEYEKLCQPSFHRGDSGFLNDHLSSPERIAEKARAYWNGELFSEDPVIEVLFRGFFTIRRVVRP